MSLYLLQADIDMRNLATWSNAQGHPDGDRAAHALIYRTFGKDDVPRAFIVNEDAGYRKQKATLLAYTGYDADQLQEIARRNQDLSTAGVMSPLTFRTNELPERWREGTAVAIEVRLVPTYRSQSSKTEYDVHRRHDAADTPQETYCRWATELLTRKAGVEPAEHTVHVTKYRRREVQRQWGQRTMTMPDVTVRASCILRDTETWEKALRLGVGRHKSFGYGMLLVRPVQ